MATIKSEVQAASLTATFTPATFATLNPTTNLYCVTPTINHATNDPLDVLIFVSAQTTNTLGASSNKQVVVFAKGSIDGSTFGSGPESGTSTTDEADLHFVGTLPINSSSVTHSKVFSLAAAYGGVLPLASKIVLKNDTGVALTAGTVQISEVWGVAV